MEHLKVSDSSEAGLLIKRLCLAAALGVTNFIAIIATNSVTLVVLLKSKLDVQQTHLSSLKK